MQTPQILIVEDEPKISQLLSEYLQGAGFRTHVLADGLEVIDWVRQHPPQMMLLDLMLPGRDGLDICRELRTFSDLPVIMVTARVEEIDRLLGLEIGADDYICKPFSPREVVARAKAVMRRLGPQPVKRDVGLRLDEGRLRVGNDERWIELTYVEFGLLQTLMAEPGRIYGRELLMDRAYSDQRVVSDRTIDSHIKKLRKKLGKLIPEQPLIHSVYGVGYKFEMDVAT